MVRSYRLLSLSVTWVLGIGCAGRTPTPGAHVAETSTTASSSESPFEYLMGPEVAYAATACGYGGIVTPEWVALGKLVEARDEGKLREIAEHAETPVGRALGIIGRVRLGALDESSAKEKIAAIEDVITTCDGCMIDEKPASELLSLASAPPASSFSTQQEFERRKNEEDERTRKAESSE